MRAYKENNVEEILLDPLKPFQLNYLLRSEEKGQNVSHDKKQKKT